MQNKRVWLLPFETKITLANLKKIGELVRPIDMSSLSKHDALFFSKDIIIMYPTLRNIFYALLIWRYKLVLVNGEPFQNSRYILLILFIMQWRFTAIFTHINWYNRFLHNGAFLPVGGCWVEIKSNKPVKKKNLCSIISSSKNSMPGHKLRHAAIKLIKTESYSVDVMGSGYLFLEDKVTGLMSYKYSIVIENCVEKDYFTEKLIDCFETDVVPIYWGCPNIESYFDTDGMIIFNNLDELNDILATLATDDYKHRSVSISKNKRLAKNFGSQIHRASDILLSKR